MGSIYEGQSVVGELLMGVPTNADMSTSSPSVVIGPPTGADVASYFHSMFKDDLYQMLYMQMLYNSYGGLVGDGWGDELDDDWEEVY